MLLPGGATLTGQKSPLKPTRQMHRHIHSAALQRNGFAFPRRLPRQTGQNTPGGISIARRASRSLAEITASCQRTVRAIFIAGRRQFSLAAKARARYCRSGTRSGA